MAKRKFKLKNKLFVNITLVFLVMFLLSLLDQFILKTGYLGIIFPQGSMSIYNYPITWLRPIWINLLPYFGQTIQGETIFKSVLYILIQYIIAVPIGYIVYYLRKRR